MAGLPRAVKPLAANSVTTTLLAPLEQWQIGSFPALALPKFMLAVKKQAKKK